MKVFLPAIKGLVPNGMVCAIAAFLDFCYIVWRAQLDVDALNELDKALARFHAEREVFIEHNIRDNLNLPQQHSLNHHCLLVQLFGAPNGLCSLITESKHISAVKDAYHRSSRNSPLGEMLLINQRNDKLVLFCNNLEPLIPPNLRTPRDLQRTMVTVRAMPPPRDNESNDKDVGSAGRMLTSEGDVQLPKRAGASHLFCCTSPTNAYAGCDAFHSARLLAPS